MLVLYAGLLLLTLCFLLWRSKKTIGRRFPGPKGLPLVGNAFQLGKVTMHLILSKWALEFGPVFEISMFGQRIIVLNEEKIIRKALSNEALRGIFAGRQKNFFGEYIITASESISMTSNIEVHSKLRKLFVKAMHVYGEGIPAFESLVTKELTFMIENMGKYEGQDFDPSDFIRVGLANITSMLLIGSRVNETEVADDMFWNFTRSSDLLLNAKVSQVASILPVLRFLPGEVRRRYLEVDKYKRQVLERGYTTMKATFEEGKVRGLVDYLFRCQAEDGRKGRQLVATDERIRNILLESILGGLNTSSSTIISIILCLIHDQGCQDRLYREILHVIGPDSPPTLEVRPRMPYTEAVIHESLRYNPPLPLAFPNLCTADVDFEGFRVKKGDIVITNVWHVHHQEALWQDPFVFRPERYLDHSGELLPPSHELRKNWLPFGIGKRQCVGEGFASSRLFLFVCTLFQRYHFLPPAEGECISSDPRTYNVGIALHPNDFKCRIKSR